jgi:hypothetical protein
MCNVYIILLFVKNTFFNILFGVICKILYDIHSFDVYKCIHPTNVPLINQIMTNISLL